MTPTDFEQAVKLLLVIGMSGGLIIGLRSLAIWSRRVSQGGGARSIESGSISGDTAELREKVEHLVSDVAELQERVDFAERMLARQRDAERLKG